MKQTICLPASAAILIGGRSSRFGTDKALLNFKGKSLALTIYEHIFEIFKEVYFVSNRPGKDDELNKRILLDVIPNKGALGGLYSALFHATNEYCFITACDLPFIGTELIQILWDHTGSTDIIAPIWGENIEPLAAFYHRRCLSAIEKAIHKDKKMVKGFWDSVSVALIDMCRYYSQNQLKKLFFNINTRQDFNRALKLS